MIEHRRIVSRGFRLAGWTVAAPSVVAALGFGLTGLVIGVRARGAPPQYLSVSHYGLAGLLSNGATGVGQGLTWLNALAASVLGGVALAALAAALFGGALWLIGRGLAAEAVWARLAGGALSAVALLLSLAGLLLTRGEARLVDGGLLAASGYALWAIASRVGRSERAAVPQASPTK